MGVKPDPIVAPPLRPNLERRLLAIGKPELLNRLGVEKYLAFGSFARRAQVLLNAVVLMMVFFSSNRRVYFLLGPRGAASAIQVVRLPSTCPKHFPLQ